MLKSVIIWITALVLGIFSASFLWMGLSPFPPSFLYILFGSASVILVCLLLLNLGFAVLQPKRRIAHLSVSMVIILIVGCGMPLCGKLIGNRQRQWFFQNGRQMYQHVVDKIIQNKAKLTSINSPLNDIVGRLDVYGRTNADGSLTVFFIRGNNSRWCWLYYSGSKMIVSGADTNTFSCPDIYGHLYFHLTNDWYESVP